MGWWLELDGKDLGEGTDSMEMMEKRGELVVWESIQLPIPSEV